MYVYIHTHTPLFFLGFSQVLFSLPFSDFVNAVVFALKINSVKFLFQGFKIMKKFTDLNTQHKMCVVVAWVGVI